MTIDTKGFLLGDGNDRIHVPDEAPEHDVTISITRLPSIRGRVVTTRYEPAPDYTVTHEPAFAGYRGWATTDDNGNFELFPPAGFAEEREVSLRAERCGDFGLPTNEVAAKWGDDDVVVIVHPATTIALEVVSPDLEPIQRFRLHVHSMNHAHLTGQVLNKPHALVDDPEGRTNVSLLPGRNYLTIFPERPGLLPQIVSLDVPEASPSRDVRVLLAKAPMLDVKVTHDGQPVAGAAITVGLRSPDHEGPLPDALIPAYDLSGPAPLPSLHRFGRVLQSVTNASGEATATLRSIPYGLVDISVRADGFMPQVSRVTLDRSSRADGPVSIELRPSVTLRIRCEPRSIYAFKPRMRISGEGTESPERGFLETPAGDDPFVFGDLAEGVYSVDISFASLLDVPAHEDVARLSVGAEGADVTLDLTKWIPREIRGVCVVNGEPGQAVRLHRSRDGLIDRGWIASSEVNPDGSFRFTAVPVGEFGLSTHAGSIPICRAIPSRGSASEPVIVDIIADVTDTSVNLIDADGRKVAAGSRVFAFYTDHPLMKAHIELAADGILQLEGVDPGRRVSVRVLTGDHAGATGSQAQAGATEIVLR